MKRVSFCFDYNSCEEKLVSIECSGFSYSFQDNLYIFDFGDIRYHIPIDSLYYFIVEDI